MGNPYLHQQRSNSHAPAGKFRELLSASKPFMFEHHRLCRRLGHRGRTPDISITVNHHSVHKKRRLSAPECESCFMPAHQETRHSEGLHSRPAKQRTCCSTLPFSRSCNKRPDVNEAFGNCLSTGAIVCFSFSSVASPGMADRDRAFPDFLNEKELAVQTGSRFV